MKVRHESPRPELAFQVRAAIFLETPNGEVVRIDNWSLSEFLWPEGPSNRPETGTLSIPFQDVAVRFPVRLEACGEGGRTMFSGLSGRQRETLSLFYRSILSGRMVSSGDMITSLDTPVDLVPMEETTDEVESAKPTRVPRPFRAAFSMVLYTALALWVMAYMGGQIWSWLDRVDIQHGRVVAETSFQAAPYSGFVKEVHVRPGDYVEKNQLLVSLVNPGLEEDLRHAEQKYKDAVRDHEMVQKTLDALDDGISRSGKEAAFQQVGTYFQDHLEGQDYRDLQDFWRELRHPDSRQAETVHPVTIMRKTIAGVMTERARQMEYLRDALNAARKAMKAAHIYAVSEGTVCEVLVRQGEFLQSGASAVDLEHDTARLAIGWTSERLTETIFAGMPARVGLIEKGTRKTLPGEVVSVVAGDHPTRPGEFGIIVTVSVSGMNVQETRAALKVGAPVNLAAERRILPRLWESLYNLVGQST